MYLTHEAETKWLQFYKRHFKTHLLERTNLISFKISLKFVHKGPFDNKSALGQVIAWRRTGNKPLSEPMMAQLTDACMRHAYYMLYAWRSVVFGICFRKLPRCGIYTTGKIYGIFLFQRFFAFLWSVQDVSVIEIHSYEPILLLGS